MLILLLINLIRNHPCSVKFANLEILSVFLYGLKEKSGMEGPGNGEERPS